MALTYPQLRKMGGQAQMDAVNQAISAGSFDINSILGTMVDRGPWPYYDTLYLQVTGTPLAAAVSGTYTPFSIPSNQPDPVGNFNKTFSQTNMISSGSQNGFGATRCFILTAFGFYFPSWLPKACCDSLMECMNFSFQIAEKPFFQGRMEHWPGGAGMTGASTQTGEESWANGFPTPVNMRKLTLQYAKYIAPQIPFTFTISFPTYSTSGGTTNPPTLTTGTAPSGVAITNNASNACVPFLRIVLDGFTDRAVQ
jgi:hypothetical protein